MQAAGEPSEPPVELPDRGMETVDGAADQDEAVVGTGTIPNVTGIAGTVDELVSRGVPAHHDSEMQQAESARDNEQRSDGPAAVH